MKIKAITLLLVSSLTVGCAKLPGLDSISNVQNVGSISDMKPKLGDVDLNQAAGAAMDIGKAITVSDEEISKMALGYADQSDHTNKIAPSGSTYVKRLLKLTSKHTEEDGLKLNYKVYLDQQVNAFSLADGSIRVYSGLMDLMNDDELLSIIGHEIGHVKLGHSADRIRLANAASGLRKGVGSTSTIAGAVANENILGGMIEKVINSQFSQSQETDSDEYGVNFLKKHGYKLDGAITSFNKLAELEGKSGTLEGILASHPASEDRAKHLAEIIGEDSKVQIAEIKESTKAVETKVSTQANSAPIQPSLSVEQPVAVKTAYKQERQNTNVASFSAITPGWYVQVAAKTDQADAKLLEDAFVRLGFVARQQSAIVNGVKYYRIVIGPYSSNAKAEQSKQKIEQSSITNEEPFIRVVK